MCSPSPAVAVKTRSPEPNKSSSLNPNATPFIHAACHLSRDSAGGVTAGSSATTTLISVALPQLMTSAPAAVDLLPPLLPHQLVNRHSSQLPPTFSHSSAAPVPVPTFPHHHHFYYYYYCYHHQTALHSSFRPTCPHPAPAAAYHHFSAAASSPCDSSFQISYSNQQVQYGQSNPQIQQPPKAVLTYSVQPQLRRTPAPQPKYKGASGGKLQRRLRVGMMATGRRGVTRGGSHRPIRASPPAWKIAGSGRVSSSSSSSSSAASLLGKSAVAAIKDPVTSLMIRNIPNHFQRFHLLQYLDAHCADENKKLLAAAGQLKPVPPSGEVAVVSEYDFFYLPMDFRTGANLGYAFVNFTSAVAATRFQQSFSDYKWNSLTSSSKICKITPAEIQGKEGLMNHFKNSKFRCKFDYYLPVVFSPPRDGLGEPMTVATTATLIGQRLPPKLHHRRGRHHLARRSSSRLGLKN